MKTYKYVVILQVEVEAFNDDDAKDVLLDTFGVGDEAGVKVVDVTIKAIK